MSKSPILFAVLILLSDTYTDLKSVQAGESELLTPGWSLKNCRPWLVLPPQNKISDFQVGSMPRGITGFQKNDAFHDTLIVFHEVKLVGSDVISVWNTYLGDDVYNSSLTFLDRLSAVGSVPHPPFIQSFNGNITVSFSSDEFHAPGRSVNISVCESKFFKMVIQPLNPSENPIQGSFSTEDNQTLSHPFNRVLEMEYTDTVGNAGYAGWNGNTNSNGWNGSVAVVNNKMTLQSSEDYVTFYIKGSGADAAKRVEAHDRYIPLGAPVPRFQDFQTNKLLIMFHHIPNLNFQNSEHGRLVTPPRLAAKASSNDVITEWDLEFGFIDKNYRELLKASGRTKRQLNCLYQPTFMVYTDSPTFSPMVHIHSTLDVHGPAHQFRCIVFDGWKFGGDDYYSAGNSLLFLAADVGKPQFDWDKTVEDSSWEHRAVACKSTMTVDCSVSTCFMSTEEYWVYVEVEAVPVGHQLPNLINMAKNKVTILPEGSLVFNNSYKCPIDTIDGHQIENNFQIIAPGQQIVQLSLDNIAMRNFEFDVYDGEPSAHKDSLLVRINEDSTDAGWYGVLPSFCTHQAEISVKGTLLPESVGPLISYQSAVYADQQDDICGVGIHNFPANLQFRRRTPQYPCNRCKSLKLQVSTSDGWFLRLYISDRYLHANGDVKVTSVEDGALVYSFETSDKSENGVVSLDLCSNEILTEFSKNASDDLLRYGFAAQWEAYIPEVNRPDCNFWMYFDETIYFNYAPNPSNASYTLLLSTVANNNARIHFPNPQRFREIFDEMEIYLLKKDILGQFIPAKFIVWKYPNKLQFVNNSQSPLPPIEISNSDYVLMKIKQMDDAATTAYAATVDLVTLRPFFSSMTLFEDTPYELMSGNHPFPPLNNTDYIYNIHLLDNSFDLFVNVTYFYLHPDCHAELMLCEANAFRDDCDYSQIIWKITSHGWQFGEVQKVGSYSIDNPMLKLSHGRYPHYNFDTGVAQGFRITLMSVPGEPNEPNVSTAISLAIVIAIVVVIAVSCMVHLHQRNRRRRTQQNNAISDTPTSTPTGPPNPAERNAWLSPTDAALLTQYAAPSDPTEMTEMPPPPSYDDYLSKSYEILPNTTSELPVFVPPYIESSLNENFTHASNPTISTSHDVSDLTASGLENEGPDSTQSDNESPVNIPIQPISEEHRHNNGTNSTNTDQLNNVNAYEDNNALNSALEEDYELMNGNPPGSNDGADCISSDGTAEA